MIERTYANLMKWCVVEGRVPPAPGDAEAIATLWAELERSEKGPGRDDLALLRLMLVNHETRSEELRRQASEHGVQAVTISRQIAELPCDIDRSRNELILHLGWYHKKRPPIGMGKPGLVAIHNKLLGEAHD